MNADQAETLLAAATPVPPTVWYGSSGTAVLRLQTRLAEAGLYVIDDGDDRGHFGRCTEQALKAFQSVSGLRTDGVCGPVTWQRFPS
jgi:peptidoglycan hydrolase-like protein with peptidoglycan-binding domain